MTASFDLYLLPIVRLEGQEQPEYPGLYATAPPRRSVRNRQEDHLVLYFSMMGNAPFSVDLIPPLLQKLARVYYRTPGTITAALRTVAEALNQLLMERNLRSSNTGKQGVGLLSQIVLRGENFFLAHSGPVQTFLITPQDTQYLCDLQGSGRGLGISRTTPVRFFQVNPQVGDFLYLVHQPLEGWSPAALRFSPGQGMESIRRRLAAQFAGDLGSLLIQIQTGSGKLRLLRMKAAFRDMARPAGSVPPEQQAAPAEPEVAATVAEVSVVQEAADLAADAEQKPPSPALTAEDIVPRGEETIAPAMTAVEIPVQQKPAELPLEAGVGQEPAVASVSSLPARLPSKTKPAKIKKPAQKRPSAFKRSLRGFGERAGNAGRNVLKGVGFLFAKLGQGVLEIIRRILPDQRTLNISPSTLIFLAVAIPVVIGVIGAVTYVKRGQQLQFQQYYQMALTSAEEATAQTDPNDLRVAWNTVLGHLDKAEQYQVTEGSRALRLQARSALDQLDEVERLDFQPALANDLPSTVEITRMVATASELYMLDVRQGNVYRAMLTGKGYVVDQQFICGPVGGANPVGHLVDIVALPKGSEGGATVLGMDLSGNLLYCIPGDQPLISRLALPPTNFGSPKALTLDSGDLFVLDPAKKAVWIYRGMDASQIPHQFLGEVTSFMPDVVDMAVNGDNLFLLHADGHQTKCVYGYSDNNPTRCTDPMNYSDTRPGRQDGAVIPDSLFDQILFSPPPDPSLYLLDPNHQAIFRFGLLNLNFQQQYRSLRDLPEDSATAFAVSPTRFLFIAIVNQVFYAALP